jgi:hypothetical protein
MMKIPMTKHEVLLSLAKKPHRDREIVGRIAQSIGSDPFAIKTWEYSSWCAGVEFIVDTKNRATAFLTGGPTPTTQEPYKHFALLVSDFDKLLVAQSRKCVRKSDVSWNCFDVDEPCDIYLANIAETISLQFGLRYVDDIALHNMNLEWSELPKSNESELVSRLDYSEPNAFSLLFYEWD